MCVVVRYTIVLQIFNLRARTKEAKLQVALAELPYLRYFYKIKSFSVLGMTAAILA